jgi:hypothetical protein
MVCPAISSYSFGATALIFCMMFPLSISKRELEKKYAPALDNYGQSCFVRSDFLK